MPEAVPRPPYATPQDALTPNRDITHGHFAPGDRVVIIHGVAGDSLYGDAVTVVAPPGTPPPTRTAGGCATRSAASTPSSPATRATSSTWTGTARTA